MATHGDAPAGPNLPVAANPPWRSGFVPGIPRIAYDHMGEGPLLLLLHGRRCAKADVRHITGASNI